MASIHRQLIIQDFERKIIRNAISIQTLKSCGVVGEDDNAVCHRLSQESMDMAFAIRELRKKDERERMAAAQNPYAFATH